MGRHRKPIESHRLSGADKKNPQRFRGEVPKSDLPFGEYPTDRSTNPPECWAEIAALCIPGVLTGSDRIIMEIASDLLAEYRTDPKAFTSAKLRLMVSTFGRFGMSPTDRQKLGIVTKKEEFVFSDL